MPLQSIITFIVLATIILIEFIMLARAAAFRTRMENDRERSERQYRMLADNVNDVIWTMENGSMFFEYVTPSIRRLLGYSIEEAKLAGLERLALPDSFKLLQQAFGRLSQPSSLDLVNYVDNPLDIELQRKDGSTVKVETKISFFHDPDRKTPLLLGTFREITGERPAAAKMPRLPRNIIEPVEAPDADRLTGICSRERLLQFLDYEVERIRRYSRPFGVILFDLDEFKKVNDTHGVRTGDAVLKEISQIVSATLRKADLFAKYGGEEFLILAPECRSDGLVALAEKIRAEIAAHRFDQVGRITISLGTSEFRKGDTRINMLKRVESAVAKAKKNGRNRVEAASG